MQEWQDRFAFFLAEPLRCRRQGKVGRRWYGDETHWKMKGRWCYWYRAIDHDGNLVDSLLSSTRDMKAAQRFFQSALSLAGQAPQQVTTDGHHSYPRAIQEVLGTDVEHRDNTDLNRRIEQDNSATTRCSALVRSLLPDDSVARWKNSGRTSVLAGNENSLSLFVVGSSLLRKCVLQEMFLGA